MVNITLKNNTGKPYPEVRDVICEHLRGNKAYIDCDIVVSDCCQDTNEIAMSLGDDCSPVLSLTGTIDNVE